MLNRIGAITALALVATAVPAIAANPPGVADAGSARYAGNGVRAEIAPVAPCALGGPTSGSSGPKRAPGVTFASGASSCTTTAAKSVAKASGTGFELTALMAEGGPRIRFAEWEVMCTGTSSGTNANWSYSGMSGLAALPDPVPANYVREIRAIGGELLATATFNEVVRPSPNDGSIALTMLRVRFEPGSGVTGEVRLGDTACSPTG